MMNQLFLLATCVTLFRYVSGRSVITYEVTSLLNKLLERYNKEVRPGLGVEPLYIETDISIRSLGPVSEYEMGYSFQCYLRQRWHDDRLRFHLDNVTEFTLSNRFLRFIWKPDTYFLNGKNSKAHNITVPNVFVRIRRDGRLYMSRRLTINARCPMDLSRYPMGKAVCPLELGSYGYTTHDVIYFWKRDKQPVDTYDNLAMATFELGKIETYNLTRRRRFGEFSILEVFIHLHRHIGFFVLQTYLPCYLITGLSWISFWINRDAAPARVLLGVTTILSTAAIGMTVREGLPRVPYATALDVFLNVCLVYDMAALIEYAAVNYFTKLMPKEGGQDEEEEVTLPPPRKVIYTNEDDGRESEILLEGETQVNVDDKYSDSCYTMFWRCLTGNYDYRLRQARSANADIGNSVSNIDMTARFLFPGTFILFNLFYWMTYMYVWDT